MAAIRRAEPKPHVVLADTNALWHKEKKHPVSPDFEAAWDELGRLATLELVIPEVVRGELLFQQTASAWKHLEKINEALAELSSVTASTHGTRITSDKVKTQVEEKVDRWLRGKRATVVPIPYASIDWPQICVDAVWRQPPFTSDPKNPDAEKGFRDALILATVMHVVQNETRDVNIVFICNDHLLRKTAQQRLRADQRFSAYEDIAGFASYVKLTRERLDNEFIKSILARAAEKFFSPNDPSCLYLRENVAEKISAQFSDFFEDPERSDQSPFKLPNDTAFWGAWRPLAPVIWRFAGHDFVSIEPEKIYHWKTRIIWARGYRRRPPAAGTLPLGSEVNRWNERVLILPFDVRWHAFVKDDARFYDVTLDRIELNENTFRVPAEDERTALGFTAVEDAG